MAERIRSLPSPVVIDVDPEVMPDSEFESLLGGSVGQNLRKDKNLITTRRDSGLRDLGVCEEIAPSPFKDPSSGLID